MWIKQHACDDSGCRSKFSKSVLEIPQLHPVASARHMISQEYLFHNIEWLRKAHSRRVYMSLAGF